MKTELYSIYDKVAEQYAPVFHSRNEQSAIRSFVQAVEKFGKNKGDFELVKVGEFLDETGRIFADSEDYPKIVFVEVTENGA